MGAACSSCPDGYTAFQERVYKSTVCLCVQKQTVRIGDINLTVMTDITSGAEGIVLMWGIVILCCMTLALLRRT